MVVELMLVELMLVEFMAVATGAALVFFDFFVLFFLVDVSLAIAFLKNSDGLQSSELIKKSRIWKKSMFIYYVKGDCSLMFDPCVLYQDIQIFYFILCVRNVCFVIVDDFDFAVQTV